MPRALNDTVGTVWKKHRDTGQLQTVLRRCVMNYCFRVKEGKKETPDTIEKNQNDEGENNL